MRIRVDMIDPACVESARPSYKTMYLISLGQKIFRQIRPILARDSCYECFHFISVKTVKRKTLEAVKRKELKNFSRIIC